LACGVAITTPERGVTKLTTEELRKIAKEIQLEKELQRIRESQKTAQYMEKSLELETEPPFISELEKQFKVEKAAQIVENLQAERKARREVEKIAQHMNELKESDVALDRELYAAIEAVNEYTRDSTIELPRRKYG
jgi:hypothetical protein